MEHNIYMFWTNTNPLSKNRDYGIKSAIKNFNGCNVVFLNKESIDKYILPNHPLHCGYKYLSENHKSDYLRSYFMNFYGGGYADIKPYTSDNNWNECFDLMDTDKNIDVIGTPDSLDWALVNLKYSGYSENIIKNNLHKLLCNGWFVCRKNSEFTQKWYKAVQDKMDERLFDLKDNPAKDVFGKTGNYPLRWGEMQAEIFQKLLIEYDESKISNMLKHGRDYSIKNYR